MAKWVECRYINEVGRVVGLTFCYSSEDHLKEIFFRYALSKENLVEYNVFEGDKLVYSLPSS